MFPNLMIFYYMLLIYSPIRTLYMVVAYTV